MPTPTQPVTATELFARHHQLLRRNVRPAVNTSDENVEDACMFAWTNFLSWDLEHIEVAYSWLSTVAIREAVKLDRRSRRTHPLVTEEDEVIEVVDPKDQLQLTRLLAETGAVVRAAGLSRRQPTSSASRCSASAMTRSSRRPAIPSARSSGSSCAPATSSPAR